MQTILWLLILLAFLKVVSNIKQRIRIFLNGDFNRLHKLGLPQIEDFSQLANFLKISETELNWLIDKSSANPQTGISRHYVLKEISKKNGKKRLLHIPKAKLKEVQWIILDKILNLLSYHPAAHAFCFRKSIVTNAENHLGKAIVIRADLKDFFHTIRTHRVRAIFRRLGYSYKVAYSLALLCTSRLPNSQKRALPQGAPTSPAISNLIAFSLDRRLTGLALKLGFTYTRYADDLIFSGNRKIVKALLKNLKKIVSSERFILNKEKLLIARAERRQKVTGITVNQKLSIPRNERKKMRAILHNSLKTGLEKQNLIQHPNFKEHLRGKLSFFKMVNPDQARPLIESFNKTVKKELAS
ncbi:MAG: RNA-directed DNA polymerase [Candidatus Riflebacteria bacterium]|nr:RNA-directed DNA polymerase [Candidatus Riflebacteria bacterium]